MAELRPFYRWHDSNLNHTFPAVCSELSGRRCGWRHFGLVLLKMDVIKKKKKTGCIVGKMLNWRDKPSFYSLTRKNTPHPTLTHRAVTSTTMKRETKYYMERLFIVKFVRLVPSRIFRLDFCSFNVMSRKCVRTILRVFIAVCVGRGGLSVHVC